MSTDNVSQVCWLHMGADRQMQKLLCERMTSFYYRVVFILGVAFLHMPLWPHTLVVLELVDISSMTLM